MKTWVKNHKMLVMVFLLLVAGAMVWAGAELSGQANATAADAGGNSADMEMASLDTVTPPKKEKAPDCDWQLDNQLRAKIKANDEKYQGLVAKAKSERSGSGKVSDGTKEQVRASAKEFQALNEEHAKMWDACNCKTRANVARDAGDSRIKSAEVVIADEINDDKLNAMDDSNEKLRESRKAYAEKASKDGEVRPEDKKQIKKTVMPRVEKLTVQLTDYVMNVQNLVQRISNTGSGDVVGGMASCASGGGGGEFALLRSAKTLLGVGESLLSNVKALATDATLLIN